MSKRSCGNRPYPDNIFYDIFQKDFSITEKQIKILSLYRFQLSERENYIFTEYYERERTLREIATELSISPARVRDIRVRSVKKIRKIEREKKLMKKRLTARDH